MRGSIPPVYIVFSAAWYSLHFSLADLEITNINFVHFQPCSLCVLEIEFIVEYYVQVFQVEHLKNKFVIKIYRVSQEECARLREGVPYVNYTDITQNI